MLKNNERTVNNQEGGTSIQNSKAQEVPITEKKQNKKGEPNKKKPITPREARPTNTPPER